MYCTNIRVVLIYLSYSQHEGNKHSPKLKSYVPLNEYKNGCIFSVLSVVPELRLQVSDVRAEAQTPAGTLLLTQMCCMFNSLQPADICSFIISVIQWSFNLFKCHVRQTAVINAEHIYINYQKRAPNKVYLGGLVIKVFLAAMLGSAETPWWRKWSGCADWRQHTVIEH